MLVRELGSEHQRVLPDVGVEFVDPVRLVHDILAIIAIVVGSQRIGARGRNRAADIDVLVEPFVVGKPSLVLDGQAVVELMLDHRHCDVLRRRRGA